MSDHPEHWQSQWHPNMSTDRLSGPLRPKTLVEYGQWHPEMFTSASRRGGECRGLG